MAWTIEYTASARQALRKMDKPTAQRIVDYLDQRVAPLENPRNHGKALTGPLKTLWRCRVGDYRLICDIQDDILHVLVVQIGHRSAVYR